MLPVLVACVMRCCRLPFSTPVSNSMCPVTATIMGDPSSRSQAIALRFWGAKLDAVLWVSPQGGIMCSCFHGTQYAVLFSVWSRTTDCKHTAALQRRLVASGVSVGRFVERMRLGINAAEFAAARQYGTSVVWTVLYQTVFSLATFTAGNVAACVDPGCRRFRGKCGHVRVARPLNSEFKAQAAADALANPRSPKESKEVLASNERATCIVSPDEDQGVKTLSCDTARDKGDSALHQISRRNMLACVGEMEDCAARLGRPTFAGCCTIAPRGHGMSSRVTGG